ncbi:hypothetical protein B0T26DRAFT_747660 [Lasiosphaeria miniovina]|uniref:Uncharacterized protein n=1 Tax=Lasiosphaeria miniovina TaxID=1954250 RepID=A0AA40B458_9PEZI|nr:uncharacterized protein B0T26DRAFT_747660 [Lasiosphaeria miniovina]KAK0727317.1 hypothetical protein B0T26DRAFT_747660 [Lasiosphaeria miniovina]
MTGIGPALAAGKIEWNSEGGGSVVLRERFYGIAAVDKTFRGVTVIFSPSALGYVPVSAWQMLSFLSDLGPVYAVWTLESCRAGNAWSPAALMQFSATFWTTPSQLVGIGSAGPVFYFLLLPAYYALQLPLILALHNAEVLAAYLAPDLATRYYWTWAWQLSPTWIGLANSVGAHTVVPLLRCRFAGSKALLPSSPRMVLADIGLVAAGVWVYTLAFAPYSAAQIFVPGRAAETDFISHTRRALQFDELCSFAAGFLWLSYSVGDLYAAALIKGGLDLVPLVLLPIIGGCVGPGALLAVTWWWWWRETKLSTIKVKRAA